jgi:hypothetical protein
MLAPLVIHPPTPKSYACRMVSGWNPRLARIHLLVGSPCQVERGASTVSAKIASTPILPIFLLPIIQILAIDHSESIDELVLVNDCLLENPDYKCENLRQ